MGRFRPAQYEVHPQVDLNDIMRAAMPQLSRAGDTGRSEGRARLAGGEHLHWRAAIRLLDHVRIGRETGRPNPATFHDGVIYLKFDTLDWERRDFWQRNVGWESRCPCGYGARVIYWRQPTRTRPIKATTGSCQRCVCLRRANSIASYSLNVRRLQRLVRAGAWDRVFEHQQSGHEGVVDVRRVLELERLVPMALIPTVKDARRIEVLECRHT